MSGRKVKLADLPAEYSSAPSIWVDAMRVSTRHDGLAAITFQTVHPEREVLIEAVRVQTTVSHLRAMIGVLENSLKQHEAAQKGASRS